LDPARAVGQSVHGDLYIGFYVKEGLEISIQTRRPRGEPFIDESGECTSLRLGQP
jgi:hypothetical protein